MIKGNKKEIYNYNTKHMYYEALSFDEAARRLGDWQVEGKQPKDLLAIPQMVNKAFAIELYLKILLIVEKEFKAVHKEKHNLFTLYDALRAETKDTLHRHGVFYEDLLNQFSDAFMACRYFYEYDGFIVDGIPTFIEISKALKIIVEDKLTI